jgi:protein-tyrosine phosphatase
MNTRRLSPLVLDGAPNFRELAGLRSGDGRTLRRGRIYRSEALHGLTSRDVQRLAELRIRLAFDLRTPAEREGHANRWPRLARPDVHLVDGHDAAFGSLLEQLRVALHGSPEAVRALMIDSYRAMPEAFAGTLSAVAVALTSSDGPVLVHCAAGKDRTGFICAVLLLAVGVPYGAVEHDYLVSRAYYGPRRLAAAAQRATGVPVAAATLDALDVRSEYLRAALRAIDERHGSLGGYLERRVGLGPGDRAELRDALLEPRG